MATWGNQVRETMLAGADLSSEQFTFVKMNTTDRTVVQSNAGEASFGVLQNDPTSGGAATVCTHGRTLINVGSGGITAGDQVTSDNEGQAVTAGTGDIVLGICVDDGAASTVTTIDFFRGGNAA